MSILDQSRALPHIAGMPPGSQPIMPPHAMDGPPNSEVLLALLARNKALEGRMLFNIVLAETRILAKFEKSCFVLYNNFFKVSFLLARLCLVLTCERLSNFLFRNFLHNSCIEMRKIGLYYQLSNTGGYPYSGIHSPSCSKLFHYHVKRAKWFQPPCFHIACTTQYYFKYLGSLNFSFYSRHVAVFLVHGLHNLGSLYRCSAVFELFFVLFHWCLWCYQFIQTTSPIEIIYFKITLINLQSAEQPKYALVSCHTVNLIQLLYYIQA